MPPTRWLFALLVLALPPTARAFCIAPPANADCVPNHPLKGRFIEAVQSTECHDVLRVDEEGRDLDRPGPTPLAAFAKEHGEGAIPFYEATIANCRDRFGWARYAFHALARVGTPHAVELLTKYAEPGQPNREAALDALPGVLSPQAVANRLLQEADADVRRTFAIALWAHADRSAVPVLRKALQRETDSQVSRVLRAAVLQAENPARCALVDNSWSWTTVGNVCSYECRGIDFPISRTAWRAILPCASTVSRGHHLAAPHATRAWLIPFLLVVGVEALRRGLAQGVLRKRARGWRRTVTGREAVYIGLAWCAVGVIPLGAAYVIWLTMFR